jgi:NAD(P)H-dependent FMN reductase
MSVIKIIIGSTSPHRFGPAFAAWFGSVAAEYAAANPSGPREVRTRAHEALVKEK